MKQNFITMTELAKRYGYVLNTVKQWRDRGLPYDETKRGCPEQESTDWVIANVIEPLRNVNLKEEIDRERLRSERAKADLLELDYREKAKELIQVEYVARILSSYASKFKSSMRQIAGNDTQTILESATDIPTLKNCLREIIDSRLLDLGELMLNEKELNGLISIEDTEPLGDTQSDDEEEDTLDIELE